LINMTKRSKLLVLQLAITATLAVIPVLQSAVDAQPTGTNRAIGQVSMSILPVQNGEEGQQYIITKAGYKVSIPGLGIAPDAKEVAVFKDEANNYWYVDRKGTTQKVSAEQLQWTMAQINQQQAVKGMTVRNEMPSQMVSQTQAAANQTTPNVIVQNTVPGGQYPSGGSNATMSGAAAMGGAMAGSAIGASMYNDNNGYHGIPYGAPCYSEGGQRYYMRANGARVPIAADSNNAYLNQWDNQRPYQGNVNSAQRDVREGENDVNRIMRRFR
jgi:hypothetical protein